LILFYELFNSFGGTFAKLHKPNAKAKFCKRATKPKHKDTVIWSYNNTTEKKHEPVTAVLQKSGIFVQMNILKRTSSILKRKIEVRNPLLRKAAVRYRAF
jgi:hypothetical protein